MKKLHVQALILLLLVGGLVGCDHSTKRLAREELRQQDDISLISGVLDLSYRENRGVGFNVLRSIPYEVRHPLALGVSLLLIPFIAFVWIGRRREPWPLHLAFALVIAGALGNLLDRAMLGYVIDFIHLHHWPVFNMADVYLTCGAILIAFGLRRRRAPEPAPT